MELIEKLDSLMKERKMNKNILSKETGIPYTTIDAFFKNGTENMKLSNLLKLANYFNVSLDYLADDTISKNTVKKDQNYDNYNTTEPSETRYYVKDDAAQYAQEILNNEGLRILFDASRDVSKEDLVFVAEMVKKFKRD